MKGKPWTVEEENKLRKLLSEGVSIDSIAAQLGKSRESVAMKASRLGLDVVVTKPKVTTTSIKLPDKLPSVEDALRILAAALQASSQPGLSKDDVMRLQAVATLARTYKQLLADYVNYRQIEAKLLEMEEKYARLLREKGAKSADNAS
ncbi:hypothetical protein G4O51_12365 [Candidatus Bathyarchaeota archaeon A05DMB-2]|jgi:hypothetical protein|nr:hypothetical protein [Candidatus Bathyarchaeota archaeon A05DMB-2]